MAPYIKILWSKISDASFLKNVSFEIIVCMVQDMMVPVQVEMG